MAPRMDDIRDRLLSRVIHSGDCWEWTGSYGGDGYPVIGIRRRQYRAHRIAFEVFRGEQANDFLVCHRCDNPKCINPDHLFLGTAKDNTADCFDKGRRSIMKDLAHPNTKIPHSERPNIVARRNRGESLKAIASTYGVAFQTISLIYHMEKAGK